MLNPAKVVGGLLAEIGLEPEDIGDSMPAAPQHLIGGNPVAEGGRKDIAPDLLNEMFFVVKATLRERILERSSSLAPEELEAAFSAAEARISRKAGPLPADYDDAVRYVSSKKLRKRLNTELLVDLLTKRDTTKLIVAFADMTGLSFAAARRAIESPSIDPLLIACRAAEFSRDDFVRVAVLRPTSSARKDVDAKALGDMFEALAAETAARVMRFVKLRDPSQSAA